MPHNEPFEILLVDDNAGDIRMIIEGLKETAPTARLTVAWDGDEAIRLLQREGPYAVATRPDLILLDLRLPKRNGFDVLKEIKQNSSLARIPVVVRSSSEAAADVDRAYSLHANCYMIKSSDLEDFNTRMKILADFWTTVVKLSKGEQHGERCG